MLSVGMRRARGQRGLSLVELMVGITVGMFVVAAASMVVATQLGDNRRMLLEVQVQQDLRATADLVARDLRRAASAWPELNQAAFSVAQAASKPLISAQTTQDIQLTSGVSSSIVYPSARSSEGPFGFRKVGNVIEFRSLAPGGGANWQPLTDSSALKITRFEINEDFQPLVRAACTRKCSDGSKDCWPTLQVRSYVINLDGESVADSNVKRSLREVVRVRNDRVAFAGGSTEQACP